jgi:hypothetical protein
VPAVEGQSCPCLALHHYARNLLAARRHASLYTEIGVLSNDGFFTELRTRIAYRILPPALGNDYLSEALDQIVYKRTDYLWIAAVPAEDWLACSTWCSTPRRATAISCCPACSMRSAPCPTACAPSAWSRA